MHKTVQELTNAVVNPGAAVHGHTAVTTAGTQVVLGTTAAIPSGAVWVKALNANTGLVFIGGSAVSSADGVELLAGAVVLYPASDIADVYVDSAVNGEGVCFWYA